MTSQDHAIPIASLRRSYGVGLRSELQCHMAFVGCMLLLCFGRTVVNAQEIVDERLEYNVKAVSLYAFGRYVTWPQEAFPTDDSPFIIGLFGANPFGDALDRIAAKKSLNGRTIVVRSITDPAECARCHIVFVPRTVPHDTEAELFRRAAGKPVLLVGESPGFANRGGIINFYQSGSNIRFELNPDKGIESRLSLNAKLLTLGTKATATK